jgi:hypothetical protein
VLNNEAAVRWTLFKDEDKGFEAYLDLPGIRRYDVLNDVSDGRGDGWVAWFEFGVNF